MGLAGIDLTLDKPRTLRFDINALAALEEMFQDAPIGAILTTRLGIRAIRNLLFVGLRHEDRKLTPERVGELIQQYLDRGGSIAPLSEAILKALEQSGILGRDAEGAAGNAPRPGGDGDPSASGNG